MGHVASKHFGLRFGGLLGMFLWVPSHTSKKTRGCLEALTIGNCSNFQHGQVSLLKRFQHKNIVRLLDVLDVGILACR